MEKDSTKLAISNALKKLMAQKPLEKITISEIMESCGMRRQHFYYYFTDIYDLLQWMFEKEAVSLLAKQEGALLWQEGLQQLFQYLSENRAVCLCALRSMGREPLKRLFETDIYHIIWCTVKQLAKEKGFPENTQEQELIAKIFSIGLAGLVESWILGELNQTPQAMIQLVDGMLQDYIRGASLRFGSRMQDTVSDQFS